MRFQGKWEWGGEWEWNGGGRTHGRSNTAVRSLGNSASTMLSEGGGRADIGMRVSSQSISWSKHFLLVENSVGRRFAWEGETKGEIGTNAPHNRIPPMSQRLCAGLDWL
jgi:hypothetical protein